MDSDMVESLESTGFIKCKFGLKVLAGIENFFMRRASGVLTVCESLTKKAQAIVTGIPIYQLEDFPVDSSSLVDAAYVEKLRSEFGVTGKRILGYTGNFRSCQGVDLLIEAFAVFKKKDPSSADVVLLMVGGDGKYKDMAAALGISDSVIFTGPRPLSEMGNVMALSEALTSPRSEGENTPLKIYSYMAANRPIVATRRRTHTQVLDDTNAYLGEPTADDFAAQISRAFRAGADEERRRLAQAAKDLVESRYSAASFKRRLGELYQEVLGASSKGRGF